MKTHTFVPTEVESFMIEQFPVGSKWLVPGLDIGIIILRHERVDGTPSWYANGPVGFEYPVAIVKDTASIIYSSDGNTEEEDQQFDLGALARCVPHDEACRLCEINRNFSEAPATNSPASSESQQTGAPPKDEDS
jgi:hypothetical protein